MKEYILDTFKIGMSEKEAEKYFSKEIKKMNITERKIYLKNERKYFKFFKILLKRNRKFIIKIREYFEYEISNLFKKEQKMLKKEIININKFNFKFKNMHLKNRKYLEIFLKISYRDAFGYQGMYTIYFPKDKIYINAITDYQFIIIFINNNKEEIIKIAKKCKLFIGLLQIRSNDEEGLESLGRPANEYVKKKFGEDNNSKIKLSTDGIDLSNADVGEKVGDVVNENYGIATFSSAGIGSAGVGLIGIGGLSLSLEYNKEELNKISNFIRFPYITVKFLVNKKLTEKDKDVMHTLSPIPENMKRPIVFPFPIPSPEERIFRLPPMVPPKQETPKERREREERIRREEQEFFNELQKPNGIPLQQEKPATIYYVEKTKEEKRVKSKGEILEEIGKADSKLDEQEGIKRKNGNIKKRKIYETKEGYTIYADDFHSKVEYEVFNKKGKHIGTISAKTIIEKGFHKEDIDTSKKDPKKRIDK